MNSPTEVIDLTKDFQNAVIETPVERKARLIKSVEQTVNNFVERVEKIILVLRVSTFVDDDKVQNLVKKIINGLAKLVVDLRIQHQTIHLKQSQVPGFVNPHKEIISLCNILLQDFEHEENIHLPTSYLCACANIYRKIRELYPERNLLETVEKPEKDTRVCRCPLPRVKIQNNYEMCKNCGFYFHKKCFNIETTDDYLCKRCESEIDTVSVILVSMKNAK